MLEQTCFTRSSTRTTSRSSPSGRSGAPARWRGGGKPGARQTGAPGRDPRLPEPGSVLTRNYQGNDHDVTVLDDGFEYQGERYRSLSKIAREITHTNWNGYLFFGLQRRTRKHDDR